MNRSILVLLLTFSYSPQILCESSSTNSLEFHSHKYLFARPLTTVVILHDCRLSGFLLPLWSSASMTQLNWGHGSQFPHKNPSGLHPIWMGTSSNTDEVHIRFNLLII